MQGWTPVHWGHGGLWHTCLGFWLLNLQYIPMSIYLTKEGFKLYLDCSSTRPIDYNTCKERDVRERSFIS